MMGDWQDVHIPSLDPDEWPDAKLEAISDCHTDQRLRLWASQELERRAVINGLCMAKMQDAPDSVIAALCDHPNPHVQAWAVEERSRRVAKRDRDIGQHARSAEEAAEQIRAYEQAALDKVMAQAQAEFGPRIERDIKSRRYRDAAAAFKRPYAKERVKDFCQCAALDLPGYRVACESLKFYIRKEITALELAVMINVHLKLWPVTWEVTTTYEQGHDTWGADVGGGMNGWLDLVLLIQEHVSLWRFRICKGCDDLFYDASPPGNSWHCDRKAADGTRPCQRHRKRTARARERAEKRRKRADQ